MLTLLEPCVCVVAVVSYRFRLQLFHYAYHACVFMIYFAVIIRMLLLMMPCHYSDLFSCHRYKML